MVLKPRLAGVGRCPTEESCLTRNQSTRLQDRNPSQQAAQPCALVSQKQESNSSAIANRLDPSTCFETPDQEITSDAAPIADVSKKASAPILVAGAPSTVIADRLADTRAVGDFSLSSIGIKLSRARLVATTSRINGSRRHASLDLNEVLANDDGQFEWRDGGNFGASARRVRLLDNGRVLAAELRTAVGDWVERQVSLDERIENCDGELRMV